MKQSNYIVIVVLLIFVSAGAFYGGMKYQESKTPEFVRNLPSNVRERISQFDQREEHQGLRPINGEILSVNEGSITVKLPDESSKIILLTQSSIINKTEKGSNEDLSEGVQIVVFGQENSDGSITAQDIQIRTNLIKRELE